MATAQNAYMPYASGRKDPGFEIKPRSWRRKRHRDSPWSLSNASIAETCLKSLRQKEGWDSLIWISHQGCKASYRQLLTEVDLWLEAYLLEQGFSGENSEIIMEILQSLHDKIATYDPDVGIASWLAAIVDFKISNAISNQTDSFERIGAFLVIPKSDKKKDLQS